MMVGGKELAREQGKAAGAGLPGPLTDALQTPSYSLRVGVTTVPDVMGEELYGQVKTLIAEKLGKNLTEVTNDALLTDDLKADSLDMVELMMAFEELLGIENTPDDQSAAVGRVRHVRDLVNVRAAAETDPNILPAWLAQRNQEIDEYKAEKAGK